ncbi:hypothetical protein R84B8_01705 [Treponema sp. R8-4-B8]
MNENQWAESVKEYLSSIKFSDNIKVDTLINIPYACEIVKYKLDFDPKPGLNTSFETDLLIYEQTTDFIKPRIIIEVKLSHVTTHDAIVYSYKAQNHKTITPFIRYGIIIGDRKHHPLPGRLFRHGMNFDFMMSFKKEEIDKDEKRVLKELIEKELRYSNQIEEMIYNSRSKNRKHYFVLQKELHLVEMDKNEDINDH